MTRDVKVHIKNIAHGENRFVADIFNHLGLKKILKPAMRELMIFIDDLDHRDQKFVQRPARVEYAVKK
jgi:hypothetical protein